MMIKNIFLFVDWNGFVLADCVFPAFLFIMGVTTALAFKPLWNGQAKSSLACKKICLCTRTNSYIYTGLVIFTCSIAKRATTHANTQYTQIDIYIYIYMYQSDIGIAVWLRFARRVVLLFAIGVALNFFSRLSIDHFSDLTTFTILG